MAVLGVDVSQYQPQLDWHALAAQGVRFAFVRLGDGTYLDPSAPAHADGARSAGIAPLAYWFCRDNEDGQTQADRFIRRWREIGMFAAPPAPDYEGASMQGGNPATWLPGVVQYLEAVFPGRRIPYYTGWYTLRDDIGQSPVLARNVLWLPGGPIYDTVTYLGDLPSTLMAAPPGYTTRIWQACQYGRATGYDGNLDLNVADDQLLADLGASTGSPVALPVSRRVKALDIAAQKVGVTEFPPGSNVVEFWDWWGNDNGTVDPGEVLGAWCAAFVSWAYSQAGLPLPYLNGGQRPGFISVPMGVKAAIERGEFITDHPEQGDIVLYSWPVVTWDLGLPWVLEGGEWVVAGSHVGIHSHLDGDLYVAVEGNTSLSSADNGGSVMVQARPRQLIIGWWRPVDPGYTPQASPGAPAVEEAEVSETIQNGVDRPGGFDGRAVLDIDWVPANDSRVGRNVISSWLVITPVHPEHGAGADMKVTVWRTGIALDGTPHSEPPADVSVMPWGSLLPMTLHGRVSVAYDPATPVRVQARTLIYPA